MLGYTLLFNSKYTDVVTLGSVGWMVVAFIVTGAVSGGGLRVVPVVKVSVVVVSTMTSVVTGVITSQSVSLAYCIHTFECQHYWATLLSSDISTYLSLNKQATYLAISCHNGTYDGCVSSCTGTLNTTMVIIGNQIIKSWTVQEALVPTECKL